mmetsp:Transcript_29631/g.81095  ORF Transcript_29631/g.81095 Transcript_29631/m.81095 type:complete len:358 (-) Transcript_29631:51-1124(-)
MSRAETLVSSGASRSPPAPRGAVLSEASSDDAGIEIDAGSAQASNERRVELETAAGRAVPLEAAAATPEASSAGSRVVPEADGGSVATLSGVTRPRTPSRSFVARQAWPTRRFMRALAVQRFLTMAPHETKRIVWDFLPSLEEDRALAEIARAGSASERFYTARKHLVELPTSRDVALAAAMQTERLLQYVSAPLRADREVVALAVARSGHCLRFAAAPLRADREVVLFAVAQDGFALQYAAAPLRADREIVIRAASQEGLALQFATAALQADKTVVLTAVARDGYALQYAAPSLKADKEVVLMAVAQKGFALKFAAERLQADVEVVRAAVAQNGFAQQYSRIPPQIDGDGGRAGGV